MARGEQFYKVRRLLSDRFGERFEYLCGQNMWSPVWEDGVALTETEAYAARGRIRDDRRHPDVISHAIVPCQ